jgi:hypothetical protein
VLNQTLASEKATLQRLYWWSFVVRFFAGMAGWGLMYFTSIRLVVDAAYYDRVAASIANDWLQGRSSTWIELNSGNSAQPVLLVSVLACFYVLTLGVRALPILIGLYCLITAWAPVWCYRVTAEMGGSARAALFAGRLVAFLPAFVFWSAALYKEGLILLFIGILLYHAIRFQKFNSIPSLTTAVVCLIGIGLLRFYLFPLLGLAFISVILLPGRGISGQALAVRMAVIVPLVGLIGTGGILVAMAVNDPVPETFGGWNEGSQIQMPATVEEAVARIDLSRRDLATSKSGYLPDVGFESVGDIVKFMPTGILYFLTVPLPWHVGDLRQNMAIPDSALWTFAFYPLFFIGMFRMSYRDPGATILLLAPAIAMCCLYAVFVGNIGTAYRMRTQIWILLVPFVAIGWEILQGRAPFAEADVKLRIPVRRSPVQRRPRPDAPVLIEADNSLPFATGAMDLHTGDAE